VQHCSESGIDPVDERKQKERARPEMVEEERERVIPSHRMEASLRHRPDRRVEVASSF